MNGIFGSPETVFHDSIWHYGDPFSEQRTAASIGAYCYDHTMGYIAIQGKDRLTWLNTLTTQLLTMLTPGTSTEALILDARGHIEYHLQICTLADELIIITERTHIDQLHTYLSQMIFWSDISLSYHPQATIVHIFSPQQAEFSSQITEPLSIVSILEDNSLTHYTQKFTQLLCTSFLIAPDHELPKITDLLINSHLTPIGMWAYEALRIAAFHPRLSLDADNKSLPHELDYISTSSQEKAVHLHKGCYRGQETVARIHNLGQAPRRLVLLHFDTTSGDLLAPGTPITLGDKPVGRLGSMAHHYDYGTIGLGIIKRSLPVDTVLTITEHTAAIDPDFYGETTLVPPGKAAILAFKQQQQTLK